MKALQAACLVGRTDFGAFAASHGKKRQKPGVLKRMAQTIALATRDPELFKVFSLYQTASESERKAFTEEAVRVLGKHTESISINAAYLEGQ